MTLISAVALVSSLAAAAPSPLRDPAHPAPLSDYAGVYAYRGGRTVALVPKGRALVAIIDDALYPLRRVDGDEFRNGVGNSVRFRRGAEGHVVGLWEGADYFERLTAAVPERIAHLTVPVDAGRGPYRYRPPATPGEGLVPGSARAAGFDAGRLEALVRSIETERYPNVHSVLLWRDGRFVFEEYFYGYGPGRSHQLRSATKSFISALVGIAMDRHEIEGDEEPVARLLAWDPSADPYPDRRKEAITLGDLLSMRTGLACDDWDPASPGNEERIEQTPDWVAAAMDLPQVADPGTAARYCSAGAHVAGRIVERATGQDLLDLARARLFGPLGFRGFVWHPEPVAANAATFGQLYLRPRDMLKFGILFLDGGEWRGRRIISRAWVERSTRPLTRIGSRRYGYLWWRQGFRVAVGDREHTVDTILASGNGGQKIYVVPSLRLVAVFTGGNYNAVEDSPPNDIMGSVLLPQLLR
jgi:CubicO group peptidase (beta-lactamase class C family)